MTRRAYAFSDKVCNFRIAEDRPNPPSLGPTGFPYGQNDNEERIAKLLSEANKAMVANVAAAASKEANLPITTVAGQVGNIFSLSNRVVISMQFLFRIQTILEFQLRKASPLKKGCQNSTKRS